MSNLMLRMGSVLNMNLNPCTFISTQYRHLSKYISKARAKRLPMTTKRAGKGYYKGNRCRKEGRLTSKGVFVKIPSLCTELVVPDLSGFSLKAYVANGVKRHIIEVM